MVVLTYWCLDRKGQKPIGPKAAKKAFNLDPSKVLTVTDVQSLLAQKESNGNHLIITYSALKFFNTMLYFVNDCDCATFLCLIKL